MTVKAGTVHLHEGGAKAVADAVGRGRPRVAEVEEKPYKRRPAVYRLVVESSLSIAVTERV